MPWAAGMAAALIIFCAGRWTAPRDSRPELYAPQLSDVADEVRAALYEPPPGHGVIEVPSTVRDARGAVHNLQVDGRRFNMLVTRAGSARSGDVHRSVQHDHVLSGRIRVTTREHGRDIAREYGEGESLAIPAHVPHMFEFLEESTILEYWDGPFEARYYRPYREQVDAATRALH
eukprot:CAMPEP_0119414190 /NCGR_PEP_ID=MMETSP1335-20130426/6627_1 /TAXON_ID=259385 /ORGANISM="Chrysoculter rhomboideus, Strain RCC1486" /LENGTH=174 /DNA_ID=CAMNT_0007439051 /DNA_START=32 /DNA_END=556 /DNA_ORIENTATION=+